MTVEARGDGHEPRLDDHERRFQELRDEVRRRHDEVTGLDDEDADLGPSVDRLVEATDQFLAFSDRLPILRDLPARALSVQIVRSAALASALGGVLVVLGVWREVLGTGWLVVVVTAAVAAVRLATLAVAPAAGRHRRQRWTAAGCGGAALLVGPVTVFQGLPGGLACAAVHVGCLAVLLELPRGRA